MTQRCLSIAHRHLATRLAASLTRIRPGSSLHTPPARSAAHTCRFALCLPAELESGWDSTVSHGDPNWPSGDPSELGRETLGARGLLVQQGTQDTQAQGAQGVADSRKSAENIDAPGGAGRKAQGLPQDAAVSSTTSSGRFLAGLVVRGADVGPSGREGRGLVAKVKEGGVGQGSSDDLGGAGAAAQADAGGGGVGNVADQLEKLAGLLSGGLLNTAEFKAAKFAVIHGGHVGISGMAARGGGGDARILAGQLMATLPWRMACAVCGVNCALVSF